MLNCNPVSNSKMEKEIMTTSKLSFLLKFSTHSNEISLRITDGDKKEAEKIKRIEIDSASMHF